MKNDDEYFYEGGEFIRMGDHKLFINEKGFQMDQTAKAKKAENFSTLGSSAYKNNMGGNDNYLYWMKENLTMIPIRNYNIDNETSVQNKKTPLSVGFFIMYPGPDSNRHGIATNGF